MNRRSESGAAAVEFALIFPILVVLLFGIVEFGLALYDKAMITNAAREGARASIVFRADPSTGNYNPLNAGEIASVVDAYVQNHLVSFGAAPAAVTVALEDTDGDGAVSSGDYRSVTVDYTYTYLLLPGFIAALTDGISLSSVVRMRVE